MTNAPDCCVIAAIRIVNGSYVITAQGGEHAVLDADSGMTLNDLVLSGITLAFLISGWYAVVRAGVCAL